MDELLKYSNHHNHPVSSKPIIVDLSLSVVGTYVHEKLNNLKAKILSRQNFEKHYQANNLW